MGSNKITNEQAHDLIKVIREAINAGKNDTDIEPITEMGIAATIAALLDLEVIQPGAVQTPVPKPVAKRPAINPNNAADPFTMVQPATALSALNRFTCIECKQQRLEDERVFQGKEWCEDCFDTESRRSATQDGAPGGLG